eukprot:scaffold104062_cov42-Phaeocystis_antarctica.AAC.1
MLTVGLYTSHGHTYYDLVRVSEHPDGLPRLDRSDDGVRSREGLARAWGRVGVRVGVRSEG